MACGILKNKIVRQIYAIIFILYLISPMIFPTVKLTYKQNPCRNGGICVEGTIIKHNGAWVEVTKDNCVEYGYVWNDKEKFCNTRNDKFRNKH